MDTDATIAERAAARLQRITTGRDIARAATVKVDTFDRTIPKLRRAEDRPPHAPIRSAWPRLEKDSESFEIKDIFWDGATKRGARSFDKARKLRGKGRKLPAVVPHIDSHAPRPDIRSQTDHIMWLASTPPRAVPQIELKLEPAFEDIGEHFHRHTADELAQTKVSAWAGYMYDRCDLEAAKHRRERLRYIMVLHLRHGGDIPAAAERFMEACSHVETIAIRLRA